ncbi:hypothetical protein Bbad01_09150 [Bacillus badius]|nr:hypothetical protein Bbad01_09150 [Bacillus badius]
MEKIIKKSLLAAALSKYRAGLFAYRKGETARWNVESRKNIEPKLNIAIWIREEH